MAACPRMDFLLRRYQMDEIDGGLSGANLGSWHLMPWGWFFIGWISPYFWGEKLGG